MVRRKFSKEFKREAVRLMEKGGKSAELLANELGVKRNQLYKWQRQIRLKGSGAFPGSGNRGEQAEVEALRRRVAELEEENQILKEAEAYFADRQL